MSDARRPGARLHSRRAVAARCCSRFLAPAAPAMSSTEHWGTALAHGRAAAASVLADLGLAEPAEDAPSVEPPGYTMYVHGTKLRIVGLAHAAVGEAVVVHGAVGLDRTAVRCAY